MERQELKAQVERKAGRMIAVASDETRDRSGEVVPIAKWQLDNFKANPVLLWAHDYSLPPIGIAKNIKVVKKQLIFEPVFHGITQHSREVAEMFEQAVMNSFSVGFMPNEAGNELLEISAVPVPANPSARILEKSIEQAKEKAAEVESWVAEKAIENEAVSKSVIPYKEYDLASEDEAWDGPAEIQKATPEDLKVMSAWYDEENADTKGAYKLPHHRANDKKTVFRGVAAAMSALMGGRGGVDIPDADRRGVYDHLAKHYEDFGKEAPEFRAVELMADIIQTAGFELVEKSGSVEAPVDDTSQPGRLPVSKQDQSRKALKLALKTLAKTSNHLLMEMNREEIR